MKKYFAFVLMFVAIVAWAAPNPADYNVDVHVVSSHTVANAESLTPTQFKNSALALILDVTIDGKNYELVGNEMTTSLTTYGVIAPGDYKARVTKDQHKGAYLYAREYEILFPDGKTQEFYLSGMSE